MRAQPAGGGRCGGGEPREGGGRLPDRGRQRSNRVKRARGRGRLGPRLSLYLYCRLTPEVCTTLPLTDFPRCPLGALSLPPGLVKYAVYDPLIPHHVYFLGPYVNHLCCCLCFLHRGCLNLCSWKPEGTQVPPHLVQPVFTLPVQIVGIILAITSGLLIGSSFVFKKKGLLRSQKGLVAGEGVAYLKSVCRHLILICSWS